MSSLYICRLNDDSNVPSAILKCKENANLAYTINCKKCKCNCKIEDHDSCYKDALCSITSQCQNMQKKTRSEEIARLIKKNSVYHIDFTKHCYQLTFKRCSEQNLIF